jgi:hypothetical protein
MKPNLVKEFQNPCFDFENLIGLIFEFNLKHMPQNPRA